MAKKQLPKISTKKPVYTVELDEDQLYSFGGWLKENAGNLLTTAAGGVITATGLGAEVGIPMLVSGAAGLAGSAAGSIGNNDEYLPEPEIIMPRTVGKKNVTPNVMSFKKGGGLKAISKNKAKEMIANPPHGKSLSKKQKKAFQAIAHGWRPTYEDGGEIESLIELEGPSHEEGGIQFTPNAELEGGETVYKDVVNSDSIKITDIIAEEYGLPDKAIGKTIADYSKTVNNKYKDRDGDPFAMKSREIELSNLAYMSSEIAKKIKPQTSNGKVIGKYGLPDMLGDVIDPNELAMISKGYKWDGRRWVMSPGQMEERSQGYVPKNRINPNYSNTVPLDKSIDDRLMTGLEKLYYGKSGYDKKNVPVEALRRGRNPVEIIRPEPIKASLPGTAEKEAESLKTPTGKTGTIPVTNNAIDYDSPDFAEGQILDYTNVKPINQTGDPWNAFKVPLLRDYNKQDKTTLMGTNNPVKTIKTNSDTGDTSSVKTGKNTLTNLLGLAPIAMSAFQAARAAADKPDRVRLDRVYADPLHPELIDPSYQLQQVSDAYNTGNEQMSQVSRKDYMRRRIQSATEEAKTKSGVLGSVQAANTSMINNARQYNSQAKYNSDLYNLQTQMQEENINAANLGAWQSNRDFQLNNLATMAGEYARDKRLEGADERYKSRYLNAINDMISGTGYQGTLEGHLIKTGIPGITSAPEDPSSVRAKITLPELYKTQTPKSSVYPTAELENLSPAKRDWFNRNRFIKPITL